MKMYSSLFKCSENKNNNRIQLDVYTVNDINYIYDYNGYHRNKNI